MLRQYLIMNIQLLHLVGLLSSYIGLSVGSIEDKINIELHTGFVLNCLRQLVCWDCGFESRLGLGCLSVLSVVCCQVEVSATG